MTTIAQQLDNVLALAEKEPPREWPERAIACVNFLREHGPAIRAAVGGEAVPVAIVGVSNGGASFATLTDAGRKLPAGKYALYASPPATVEVGALRELVEKWKELANQAPRYGERSEGYVAGVELCSLELAALIGKEA